MPALVHDILIEQGADFQREFTVTDNGVAIPSFQSFQFRAQLRTNAGLLAEDFTIAANSSTTVLLKLTSAETTLLPASSNFSHKYDAEAVSPTGIVYRIAQGRAQISAEQTK